MKSGVAIVGLLLSLAALLLIGPRTEAAPPEQAAAQTIRVGVTLIDLSKLNVSSASYSVEFLIFFACDTPCDPSRFGVANGAITSRETEHETPTEKQYRVKADLASPFDFAAFPFDRIAPRIEIEDVDRPIEEIRYVADPRRTSDQVRFVAGWELIEPGYTAVVKDQTYPTAGETYSQYVYTVPLGRPLATAVIKSLLPGAIITLVGLIGLTIPLAQATPRVSLGSSTLLGALVAHLNMTSSLPPIGYLTFADRFMIINYLALGSCLAITCVLLEWLSHQTEGTDAEKEALRQRVTWLRSASMRLLPLLWVIVQLINVGSTIALRG